MLAGDPPFVASTPRAALVKDVTDPVPPIATDRPKAGAKLRGEHSTNASWETNPSAR
jgi:hypothetical protein